MSYGRATLVGSLAVAALLLGSCDDGAPTNVYEISGVVSAAVDGPPISGARVTFRSDTLYTGEATTDGDGVYRMSVETDAPFGQVRAEAAGFFPGEATVFFDSDVRRIDLMLRPES